jgi:hypothetical protein
MFWSGFGCFAKVVSLLVRSDFKYLKPTQSTMSDWKSGLFGCVDNPKLAAVACCCTPCLASANDIYSQSGKEAKDVPVEFCWGIFRTPCTRAGVSS